MKPRKHSSSFLAVPVGLLALLGLSACGTTITGPEGWLGNNGYVQWHPQTGAPHMSVMGTQCYFCGDVTDADGDGVPDYLDKCPDTPKGVKVDADGCPLDADGDGVPDYLDKCPDTPKGVQVDRVGCPLDSDGDGVPDYLDKCPDTPKGVKVDAKGCPLDSDGDGVIDDKDKCPNTPRGAKVNAEGCWVLENLHFEIDKSEIRPPAYPILDEVVKVLNNSANASTHIDIHGHTDNTGTAAYNDGLANRRAKAVLNYLAKHGVDVKRLNAAGFGLHNPVAPNTNREGRSLNRRVELKPKL